MQPTYPSITEADLTRFRALEIQLRSTPDLLDRPECPYPPTVKAMLRRLVGADAAVDTATDLLDPTSRTLDQEIADLYATVKRDSANYTGSDMKDKMSFLKTAQELLMKLVGLQEKRFNIRSIALTQRTLIEAMEEFLTPAQRTQFIEKISTHVDVV